MVGGANGDAQTVMVVRKEGHVTGAVTLASVALSHVQHTVCVCVLIIRSCDILLLLGVCRSTYILTQEYGRQRKGISTFCPLMYAQGIILSIFISIPRHG